MATPDAVAARAERVATIEALLTPALLVERAAMERNAAAMAAHAARLGVGLRPHVKTHKCLQLVEIQLAHGAHGVTTATVAEAVAMVDGGVRDVLLANQAVTWPALTRLAAAARRADVTLAIDAPEPARRAAEAAAAADAVLGVLIEIDIGMGRCGVREPERVVELARSIAERPELHLRGLMGYEGHCVDEPDRARRARETRAALGLLERAAELLRDAGLPPEIVSAGGTGTYDMTGAVDVVTELQAGSYLLMDEFHAAVTPEFEPALFVLASVISRHGDLAVIDAGRKAISTELARPRIVGHDAEIVFTHEEHTGLRIRSGAGPAVGDRVRLTPGYAPTTVNLHAVLNVVDGDSVLGVWPVLARHGTT
jgi:D-serine deaminase-like pyridoxal phosphate-dependent protein